MYLFLLKRKIQKAYKKMFNTPVYIIHMEILEDGCLYIIFTFNKFNIRKSKKNYKNNLVSEDTFDDFTWFTINDPEAKLIKDTCTMMHSHLLMKLWEDND